MSPPIHSSSEELTWHTSSSAGYPGTAVQVAFRDDGRLVLVKNPEEPDREPLTFQVRRWWEFCDGIRAGELRGPYLAGKGAESLRPIASEAALNAIFNGVDEADRRQASGVEVAAFVISALHKAGFQVIRRDAEDET